jgi:hypothetical protein
MVTASKSSKPSSKSPSSSKSSTKSRPLPPVLSSYMDAQAKAFGLTLKDRSRALIYGYLIALMTRLVVILTALTGHCSKANIDARDVQSMKALSRLFLPLIPMESGKIRSMQGGAETTLPSQYFDVGSSAYSTAALGTPMGGSTDALVRPALLIGGSAVESTESTESMESTIESVLAEMQTGGSKSSSMSKKKDLAALTALQKPAFLLLLADPNVPKQVPLREDAEEALRSIVGCNLLHLMAHIKAARKKLYARRGSPVATSAVRAAMKTSGFVIPV